MLNITDLNIQFYSPETQAWTTAVQQLSLTAVKGKILGIVGESGSGKSVTSFAIMRLLDPAQSRIKGQILFNGTELTRLSNAEMNDLRGNRIAMIFQEPMTSLNPVFTCGFQVQEAIRLHQRLDSRAAKEKTLELFREVQLPRPEQLFSSYPHQLSGGQKQRIMIAMALSCNPEFLIADEPTTALDVTVQQTILQLLLKLREDRGMGIIFISHDLGVMSEIADEIAVMYRGTIVEQGPAARLFSDPQHAYTKGLLACRPTPGRQLKVLPVVADFLNGRIPTTAAAIAANTYTVQEIEDRRTKLYAQPALLEVSGLNTWYPLRKGLFGRTTEVVKAVDGVSLKLFPGETLGLVGESGCGKTTLGRTILRLAEPSSGSIRFDGQDITKLGSREMRRMRKDVQLIFQDPYSSLNPRLTVGQALTEPLLVHGLYDSAVHRKDFIQQLMERVGLSPDQLNRYPHEFSGGQRQRMVIARALALQPRMLICDESVSALDISVQAQVLNLLRQLQQELGLSYIFISHDLAVVKHISDRMLVMNSGKIVEEGFPEDIYAQPRTAYTRKLIAAIPGRQLV